MIEVTMTYNMVPSINQEAYGQLWKRAIAMFVEAPGLIEIRGNRSLTNSGNVRQTTVWNTVSDWSRFIEKPEWQEIFYDFKYYATNMTIEIWGESPIIPQPIRPRT